MLRGSFRPWGPLPWLLARLSAKRWTLLGCIATEARCLETWKMLRSLGSFKHALMLEIHDEHPSDHHPSRFYERTEAKIVHSKNAYFGAGGTEESIQRFYLSDAYGDIINATDQFAAAAGPNVVIDISALPKRFFFPIIRRLVRASSIRNLLATYTIPATYTNEQLAEDPEVWLYLPTFLPPDPEPEDRVLIVGLGYEPLGLTHVLQGKEFELLFPFPSLPPGIQRNWAFVRELGPFLDRSPQRVHIYDVSETYDRIMALTNNGNRYAVLAPYGPKTMSLAMCMYAVSTATRFPASVYYTQPRVYNPDYTIGVGTAGAVPKIMGYCLNLKGKNLYS